MTKGTFKAKDGRYVRVSVTENGFLLEYSDGEIAVLSDPIRIKAGA